MPWRRYRPRHAAIADSGEVRLDLLDSEGRKYVGRFDGKLIVEGRDAAVYLTDDDRILVHDWKRDAVQEVEDEDDLRNWLDDEAYIEAADALGFTPVTDL